MKIFAAATDPYLEHIERWAQSNERVVQARATSKDTVELTIFDVVGDPFSGVTAGQVKRLLDDHPDAKTIDLVINSPGGFVREGIAIHTLLSDHPAEVNASVIGEASSIASVILMAADRRRVAEAGQVMIHEAWALAVGPADKMRQMADRLDKDNEAIRAIYSARTSITDAKLAKMMAAETFMNAKEAVELGFADEVVKAKRAPASDSSNAVRFEIEPLGQPAPAVSAAKPSARHYSPIAQLAGERAGTALGNR